MVFRTLEEFCFRWLVAPVRSFAISIMCVIGRAPSGSVPAPARRLPLSNTDDSSNEVLHDKVSNVSKELSKADLARLLGNLYDEGESDDKEADPSVEEEGIVFLNALEKAADSKALELVRSASTAVINYVDDIGRNALLILASEGQTEACRALLHRTDFAGMSVRDMLGSTPLHLAAGNDHVDICRLIVACPRFPCSGVNDLNNRGQTPLDFCLEFGDGSATEVLEAAGATSSGTTVRRGAHRPDVVGQRGDAPPQTRFDADFGGAEFDEGGEDVAEMNELD
ncbi:unnamed protein product [Prorocentrum cordatum]|uniref:Uncharacterized protein n=1 Tax=Prorocentrum cordatum TaxID=2364126 RepID=A0ABN9PY48_9DINO|nr:unnamed protein product [Polarella glacialis]|mmetsp:Transcript_62016/g.165811  ORF Transcript_62016/g.165811 Transcript_62016/m.165811 type:complete len:282 (+) Transcript_62016:1-846(+)